MNSHMKNKFTCVLAVMLCAGLPNVYAADYFVAMGGSDGNAGTADAPFSTLARGLSAANDAIDNEGEPTATVHLADGTYDITDDSAALLLDHAVTILGRPENPSGVVIRNNSTVHRSIAVIHANAAVKGVTFDRTDSSPLEIAGWNAAGHINMSAGLVEDCIIRGGKLGTSSSSSAQGANVFASGGIIRRCRILDGRATVATGNTDKYRKYVAVGNLYMFGTSGSVPVVENCLISGGIATGSVTTEAFGAKKAGNVCIIGSGRLVNCTIVEGGGSGVGGVSVVYDGTHTDCKVVNCVAYGNDGCNYNAKDWGKDDDACLSYFVNCAVGTTAPNADCIVVGASAFKKHAEGVYFLPETSPLVDAGLSWDDCAAIYGTLSPTDLAGAPRLKGEQLDVGCFELGELLDLYVAPGGSDENVGTEESPFRSVAKGVAAADEAWTGSNAAHVNVWLSDGAYDITDDEAEISLANPVSVIGCTNDPSKVVVVNNSETHRAFSVANASAELKGVTVARTDSTSTEGKGLVYVNGAGLVEDCVITNGLIGSATTAGYYNGGNVSMNNGGTLRRCKIMDGRSINPASAVGQSATYYSVGNLYVQTTVDAVLVENCLISGGYAPNMSSKNSRTGVITVHSAGNIFINADRTKAVNLVNCTIVDGSDGYVKGIFAGGLTYDAAKGNVVNSVIYGNGDNATQEFYGHADYFVNCAFSSGAGYSGTQSTVVDLSDASFKDCGAGDWRPRNASSALCDGGTTWEVYSTTYGASSTTDLALGRRNKGGSLDIGCYEFVASGMIILLR